MLKKGENTMKEGSQESDGEEIDRETADSSNGVSDSCSASEEEDSSEMDEEDCERRRSECIEDMMDLERQFLHLKEQLYQERMSQIESKLNEVRCGEAPEYRNPLDQLRENTRVRIEVAGILKQLKLRNAEQIFEAEQIAAKQNYENDRAMIQEFMAMELKEKIRRLEEDKTSFESLPSGAEVWGEFTAAAAQRRQQHELMLQQQHQQQLHKQSGYQQQQHDSYYQQASSATLGMPAHIPKQRRRSGTTYYSGSNQYGGAIHPAPPSILYDSGTPKRRKTVTVSGPYIVYMLREQDIIEDWTVIRNACYQMYDSYPLALP